MNVREALRSTDPARHLRSRPLSDSDEQLMRTILTSPRHAPQQPDRASTASAPPPGAWRTWATTGLVAVAVVAGTVLVLRAVPDGVRAPASTPTATSHASTALHAAVDAKLAAAAKQQRLDPDLPTQTWTNRQRGTQGGPIDRTGKTLYLAAACKGGGTVTVEITGQLDTTIDCTTTAVIGPINLSAVAAKAKKVIGYDVTSTEGQAEYYAKAVALTDSDVTTTSSVDTNGRILLIYPASGAGGPEALLHGVLTQNAAGCVAVGKTVVVAPSNAELHPDGSVSFGSSTFTMGKSVDLGGGAAASIPVGSPCRAATGDYFIIGDYPQPQTN